MGIDLYGFVEGFDEAKGVWENISPLTDQSQLDYDGYGYPKEAQYLFGRTLPEMIDVVRDTELYTLLQDTSGEKIKGLSALTVKDNTGKATSLTKDIFFHFAYIERCIRESLYTKRILKKNPHLRDYYNSDV